MDYKKTKSMVDQNTESVPVEASPRGNRLDKLKHELHALLLAMLYFSAWIGMLMVLKTLILAEYHIRFNGLSLVFVGALILAKVVLVLEHVPLGAWIKNRPAWVDVILRWILYTLGVFLVLLFEKSFEGRHEQGGFGPSLMSVLHHADIPHVWANTICLSGALLGYNVVSVVRRHLGKGGLLGLFLSPPPEELCH